MPTKTARGSITFYIQAVGGFFCFVERYLLYIIFNEYILLIVCHGLMYNVLLAGSCKHL